MGKEKEKKYFDYCGKEYATLEEADKANKAMNKSEELAIPAKKELLVAINSTEEEVTAAYKIYSEACVAANKEREKAIAELDKELEEAKKIYNEERSKVQKAYNEEVKKAKKVVAEAEEKHYKAIAEFNQFYGPYSKIYTGEKAKEEFYNSLRRIEDDMNLFISDPIRRMFFGY